ncbi:nucleoside-diphosphate sugar epimerase/dehydratase [uncultured Catenibacterium sp.]|uniref:polysaccharide biosynthesis protein n=1 Tax=uncultured Catenibacterium sp. TaxID=286142 RepID=UPI0025941877|nr:nucleoside-diphosphate sugar epimerase/dehydratase [uncultured Catenibacterium sp.]
MHRFKDNRVMYQRMLLLMVLDAVFTVLASYVAVLTRMEFKIDWWIWNNYLKVIGIDILITLVVYYVFKLYKSMWRYASIIEVRRLLLAVYCSDFLRMLLYVFVLKVELPRSWYFLEPCMLLILSSTLRFLYRGMRSMKNDNPIFEQDKHLINVMIIGAGEAGNMLLREIKRSSHLPMRVVCFIDDDPLKQGYYMNDVPIVGNRNSIGEMVKKYEVDEIYIALPSASINERRELMNICNDTGCKIKLLPGIYQLMNGEVKVSKLRNVEIEDLLGRDPISVNMNQIASYVENRTVMVTGGGGSIGSELCRQVAARHPRKLIIVDIYENNAYDIQMELRNAHPELNLDVRIASIRDGEKIDALFNELRPEVVYHAAAHKHVPLMEDSPNEAIKNNVFGTLNVVKAADKYHVKRFVQISTDKAVNPTNIMGASKRMCEMIIQAFSRHSRTVFTAVRFGNVLGSNGSVIPLFKKQIAHGGPVTVTDKNIIRYFMTIPEAVSLVMQAGIFAKGGEIFVLDMGEPVKIDDLARNLIKLSGFTPDVDIPIIYTGLRPGEKLYEELLMDEEGLQKTENGSIFIGHPLDFDEEVYFEQLHHLRGTIDDMHQDTIRQEVQKIVSTYHPELGGK